MKSILLLDYENSSLAAAFLSATVLNSVTQESSTNPVLKLNLIPNQPNFEISWPARLANQDGATFLPAFELQRSLDLKTWQPVGERLRGKASVPNEILNMRVPAGLALAFYRVVALPDRPLAKGTASGGAEVFGYAARFSEELDRLGQISVEEFAALHPQISYLSGIDWDPTAALFWDDFNADPADRSRDIVEGVGALPWFDFRLEEQELAVFKQLGFVVSERLGTHSFAEGFYRVWNNDLPVFVSTDAILQAWHRSYDAMLEELEETSLFFLLERMLEGMALKIPDAAAQTGDGVLKDSVLDADFFLAVARSLLAGKPVPSQLNQDARVAAALTLIKAEKLVDCVDLFGHARTVDFSQFKVRGHYENSERLRHYFQATMWLGRTDLRVAGDEFEDCFGKRHKPYERELGTAIVLHNLLLRGEQFNNWFHFDRVIQAFVGWTDSMTFAQLGDVLAAAGIKSLSDVSELSTLQSLQEQINAGQYGFQNIKSDYYVAPNGPERLKLPRSFTVFGQKFVMDSWALAKVVYDDILWVEGNSTNEVSRRVPSGLDVAFSVLNNDQVLPDLVARLNNHDALTSTNHMVRFRDGLPYQHNLEAVRRVIESQSASAWNENIYTGWLDVLRTLAPSTADARYPEAMRTRAWAMKTLNTQLASWTDLRHDTILYAKQSYTPPGQCTYPDGFIEPRPEFFARLELLARRAAELIAQLPVQGRVIVQERVERGEGQQKEVELSDVKSSQVAFLEYFAGTVSRLRVMAEKELRRERMNTDDLRFIDTLIQKTRINGAGGPRQYDGWYTQLFYKSALYPGDVFQLSSGCDKWDAIVADVHTDLPDPLTGDPGSVLHQGVGNVHMLFLAVDQGTEKVMYAGPVLSHYEFELVGPPKRMSDTDWKAGWNKAGFFDRTLWPNEDEPARDWSALPAHPEWTRSYLVPHPTRP